MKRLAIWCMASAMLAAGWVSAGAAELGKTALPFKAGVLDFVSIEEIGQQRFLDYRRQPIEIPQLSTLNDADRQSISRIMQGYIKMIDARDAAATNAANRQIQLDNNELEWQKALALYKNIVRGEARPMILAADYLSAYLNRQPDVFTCVDPTVLASAMAKVSESPDFPCDFLRNLAQETGATHLIYGTVTDIRSQERAFSGYGIATRSVIYQLDVLIKLVDLQRQQVIYGNVYTGSCRMAERNGAVELDHNVFQNLMTSALEKAAEDLCHFGREQAAKPAETSTGEPVSEVK